MSDSEEILEHKDQLFDYIMELEGTIDNLKSSLRNADIEIERCMFREDKEQCRFWYIASYDGEFGIQCDNCRKYFCLNHGERNENRSTFPPSIHKLCNNCN